MKKRLCFLTLALLTVAGLSSWAAQPKTNEGEEPFKIGGTSYSTLDAAINAVEENGTITMTKAVSDAKGISVPSNKNFTVDFGGHTYTCASDPAGSTGTQNQVFQLLKGSTIIFKNGKINVAESAKEQFRFIIQNYANLTLEGMTLDGTNLGFTGKVCYAVSNNSGTVVFKDLDESTKTEITAPAGGIAFDVCKYASYEAPTVTVNTTGTITGQVEVTGGNLVVDAGQFTSNVSTILVKSGNVTVEGGTITSTGNAPVAVKGGKVTLKAGTYEGPEGAVIFPGEGATIDIQGGTYTATDNAVIAGNGSNDRTYGNTVTISGGTFNGGITSSGYIACGIYAPWKDNITVKGGTFNITGGAGVVARAGLVTIDGGIFNCTGTATGEVGDKAIALPCECLIFDDSEPSYPGKDANSKIVVNGGTFSDMSGVNYVAEGGTYKLADNVTMSSALDINSGKKFVVDLNGKTLFGRTNIKHGDVTFVNGTINGGSNQALNVYGSSESAENYSVLTVANNVTVIADVYGVCLFGPQYNSTVGYGAVANINGTVKTTKDTSSNEGAVFVSGNLGSGQEIPSQSAMEGKNFVNITGSVTSKSDAALALNGSATVTIAESASLEGNTAIAAKRGKLVVNGGKITGNGACVGNPNGNGNGTELTGSALSASSTYGKHLTIDVKGGEFTSAAYTILNNSNDDACTFNISGGSFKTTKPDNGIAVYARLGSVNITGGTFENNSNREATLHVGYPTVGNLRPKLTISGAPLVMNKAEGNYTYNGSWSPLTVNMANELNYKAVEISGGEFHGQSPEKDDNVQGDNGNFLEEDYKVIGSKNVWTVVRAEALPVVANVSEVEITDEEGESLTLNDKEQEKVTETLTSATKEMTANTEISLVNLVNEVNEKSVASGVVGEDQSVGITVELTGTKVSVTTGGEITVALKEFTFDVTPYVVTTSDKTVVSKIENDQIIAPMTFRLPIPSSVTDQYARVYHKHDGKTTDLGLKEIQGTSQMRFIEISTTSFSEFAVKFTPETVTKPSTLYYYAGNSTKVDGTPENFKKAQTTSTNAIAFVDAEYADWASTQTNVVVIEEGTYSDSYYCPNFVLTDRVSDAVSVDFYTPVDFHVVSGYYTRDNTGNSGIKSMCLPFDLKATDIKASGANFGVYHGTDMGAESTYGSVYFNKADEVQAGTPCIVEGTEASTWNITLDGKTIKASINNTGAMKGSYAKKTFTESEITQKYKVSTDGTKFTSVTTSSNAWPFRAYLDLNYDKSYDPEIKELNIVWDDEATGIESIKSVDSNDGVVYDLTGRRVTAPVKGHLYIINGRKQLLK